MDFEPVPDSFMMEIAVYGLPVRMPHWSFGVRYIYQLIQHRMGHSRLFEVVFPGNPGHAYLAAGNSLAENVLVTAHVLGHADFSRNNLLFARSQQQVGEHIVEQRGAPRAADRPRHRGARGQARSSACSMPRWRSSSTSTSISRLRRERSAEYAAAKPGASATTLSSDRFAGARPEPAAHDATTPSRARAPLPPQPENDLLWFVAQYAPELEGWERDIFLAVREESFYFYPVFATQIMNEGWASYWHARLLREADFMPQDAYLDAIKCHSDVVRPLATRPEGRAGASIPTTSAFRIWETIIVERQGIEAARAHHARGRRLQLRPQPADAGTDRRLQLFRYRTDGAGAMTRHRGGQHRAARGPPRAQVQLRCAGGGRAARCAPMAHSSSRTIIAPTAVASTASAPSMYSSICSAYGDGR